MSDAAPSIGSIDAICFDHRNDRSKGLITNIVPNGAALERILRALARENAHGTRLCVRLILRKGVEPEVRDLNWQGFPLCAEAYIPVSGHPEIGGIASYGANSPRRRPSPEVLHDEERLYMRVAQRLPRPLPDVRVDTLDPARLSSTDVEDLLAIYRRSYTTYLVDFTSESVRGMVENNLVLVVRDAQQRIASVCVAEMVLLPFPGSLPLRLVEISDAATRIDCRGRGYYSAAKMACIGHLRSRQDGIPTVIETQARANSSRVLGSNLGRGLARAGYLPMHCVISSTNDEDVQQDGKYGNLVVFYVP